MRWPKLFLSPTFTRSSAVPEQADFLRLGGRAVLVTGASSGIGRATAIAASRAGAVVALAARRPDALDDTLALLSGEGHAAIPFDITEHARLGELTTSAVDALGRPLDGLVHAAGIHASTPVRALTAAQLARLFDVNVTSAALMVKAFRRPGVRATDASIVLMSSAAALGGEPGVSAYAASKAAVASLGRSLALELAPERIRVNSIAAGIVDTALTEGIRSTVGAAAWAQIEAAHPLGVGTPEDVAHAVLYLLSDAAKWVTGTTLVIDGGYSA